MYEENLPSFRAAFFRPGAAFWEYGWEYGALALVANSCGRRGFGWVKDVGAAPSRKL